MFSYTDHSFGFVRIGTAVPKMRVGDCAYNARKIIELMDKAQQDMVAVLVFPELCITGYTAADLFQQLALHRGALEALEAITEASKRFSGLCFVGMPVAVDAQLFNSALALHRGEILGVVPKTSIPNYKEFYEGRWFSGAPEGVHHKEVTINGRKVPFGTHLLFSAQDFEGLIVGVEICEDLWMPVPPSSYQALYGATVQVNLSASNELIGKSDYRRHLVVHQSGRCLSAYAYASCGVWESTTDVVFGGHAMIAENGSLLGETERFKREASLLVADIDLDRLRLDRMRTNSFGDSLLNPGFGKDFQKIEFRLDRPAAPRELSRKVDAHPFVPRGEHTLTERCDEIFHIQVGGLAKRLERIGRPKITIGISGGLDSTLALLVSCRAMDLLGLPRSNILAFTMPGFGTTGRTKGNAWKLMEKLGVTAKEIDIRAGCLQELKDLQHKPFGIDVEGLDVDSFTEKLRQLPADSQDLVFENVQARKRTSLLMNSGFVIGTGDLSELALGWCTYNGDHMSMYNVNASIPKTLVRFMVRHAAQYEFAAHVRETLLDVVDTEISPELLPLTADDTIAQKTEGVIGPYELHDFFMFNMLRFGMPPEKIVHLATHAEFDHKYSREEICHWLRTFIVRFFNNQFKRSCAPDGPKVGSISLSPRGDWRMPSDAEPDVWLGWVDKELAGLLKSDTTSTPGANAQSLPVSERRATKANGQNVYRVLLRVDLKNDFMPGGKLAVERGDEIVPLVNSLSRLPYYDEVIDGEDIHPADHGSFASQHPGKKPLVDQVELNGVTQQLWPDHCMADTVGCEFHKDLDRSMVKRSFSKGCDNRVDSYSCFYDNGRQAPMEVRLKYPFLGQSTGLAEYVRARAEQANADFIQVDCVGLALRYCVSFTARDARTETFKGRPWTVRVIEDACRAIVFNEGEYEEEIRALRHDGIEVIQSTDVISTSDKSAMALS